jgi:hypothetical protein
MNIYGLVIAGTSYIWYIKLRLQCVENFYTEVYAIHGEQWHTLEVI